MKIKERAKKLKEDIPALFIALNDRNTPFIARAIAVITVAYALSPIDLIPDFLPVLGYLDDIIILPLLITAAIRLIPDEVMQRCRKESENLWEDGEPKKWYCAIPIILFWLIILAIVIKIVWF